MSDDVTRFPKVRPTFKTVVLGDVEVESVIMRDPEGTLLPESARAAANAGRPAYFYFRMPGGAWMLEESIRAALEAAAEDVVRANPNYVDGFLVGWRPEDPLPDSAVSVWPTLAPRSAIGIDLFPRLPDDEKDKVFRIRHGHVTGWMQRAIEGLPVSVANILNALRAFGVCYKFYREKLKRFLESPVTAVGAEKDCREWLEILKTTLYAYIADNADDCPENECLDNAAEDQTISLLVKVGSWLHKSRSFGTLQPKKKNLRTSIEKLLKLNSGYLEKALSANNDSVSANELQQQRAVASELKQRIDDIKKFASQLSHETVEQDVHSGATLLAEYTLVLSMKTQLLRLSVHSKQWAEVLKVEEAELTAIGDQLWHVCNQLCCSYFDSMSEVVNRIQPISAEGPTAKTAHTERPSETN
ncbi:MAG: hypothetical protein U0941_30145 [Planctomycetaceae bacterium]